MLAAVENQHVAAVEILTRYKHRMNINQPNNVGIAPIHMATASSKSKDGKTILMQLIMAGANLDMQMPTQKLTCREFLRMHGVSLPGIPGLDPRAGGTGTAGNMRTEL